MVSSAGLPPKSLRHACQLSAKMALRLDVSTHIMLAAQRVVHKLVREPCLGPFIINVHRVARNICLDLSPFLGVQTIRPERVLHR